MEPIFQVLNSDRTYCKIAGISKINRALQARRILPENIQRNRMWRLGHLHFISCNCDPSEKYRFEFSTIVDKDFYLETQRDLWTSVESRRRYRDDGTLEIYDQPGLYYDQNRKPVIFVRAYLNSATPWIQYINQTIPVALSTARTIQTCCHKKSTRNTKS